MTATEELETLLSRDERLDVAAKIAAALAVAAMDRHWTTYQLVERSLEIADVLIEEVDK